MFYRYDDISCRYIGRWGIYRDTMTTTCTGAKIQIAFKGESIVLQFDVSDMIDPIPHLWIRLDNLPVKTEVPLKKYLRVEASAGEHILEIIVKSATEIQNRWFAPLQAKISFSGYTADASSVLPTFTKKTIEFVGDSITEGILVDPDNRVTTKPEPIEDDELNRPFQNDSMATYAYLTAEELGLEPIIMGYGASGATVAGAGGVPACTKGYPYCFDGVEKTFPSSPIIVINHGANDWAATPEYEIECYKKLLSVVRRKNPTSKIIALTAFCGNQRDNILEAVKQYNAETGDDVFSIDTADWVSREPLHPLRAGHKIIAEKLIHIIKENFSDII